jgi:hypothetical protein
LQAREIDLAWLQNRAFLLLGCGGQGFSDSRHHAALGLAGTSVNTVGVCQLLALIPTCLDPF